jgi:hypothetical protein
MHLISINYVTIAYCITIFFLGNDVHCSFFSMAIRRGKYLIFLKGYMDLKRSMRFILKNENAWPVPRGKIDRLMDSINALARVIRDQQNCSFYISVNLLWPKKYIYYYLFNEGIRALRFFKISVESYTFISFQRVDVFHIAKFACLVD